MDPRRGNHFFDDHHFLFTHLMLKDRLQSLKTKAKESGSFPAPNKSFQTVHVAATWLSRHLEGKVKIVVLADIKPGDNLEAFSSHDGGFKSDCLPRVLPPLEYFSTFFGADSSVSTLLDSLSPSNEVDPSRGENKDAVLRNSSQLFEKHLSAIEVQQGISDGTLRLGTFYKSAQDPSQGCVRPSKRRADMPTWEITIPSRRLQNRAISGDIVAVCVVSASESTREEQDDHFEPASSLGEGGDITGTETVDDPLGLPTDRALFPCGKVVHISQRVQTDVVACLREDDEREMSSQDSPSNKAEWLLCVPMDKQIPFIRLSTRLGFQLRGQRFIARIDGWDRGSAFPHGHVVANLGPIGDVQSECAAILAKHRIIDAPFTPGCLHDLPNDSWQVPDSEIKSRLDLRNDHLTLSIDPPGSKDVDDTLSVKALKSGLVQVGVHIADVSYFVPHGSLLDIEARTRGTTVYLVDRRIDMLPAILSENVCSLRGGVDRLAVSVIWTLDPQRGFSAVDSWFGRTVIHSRHQMEYEEAQAFFDGKEPSAAWRGRHGHGEFRRVREALKVLDTVARVWRRNRQEKGALELESAELRFETDVRHQPVKLQEKKSVSMNWVVAELMIAANAAVAQQIYEFFPSLSLLRRHSPPREDALLHLKECFASAGLSLDYSSNKSLAESLKGMEGVLDQTVQFAAKVLATRAMAEAEYFCSGSVSGLSHFHHYGLALELLLAGISHKRTGSRPSMVQEHHKERLALKETPKSYLVEFPSLADMEQHAEHINGRHRASKLAQKDCSHLYFLLFLKNSPQLEKAVITALGVDTMRVFVPKFDIQGTIYLRDREGKVSVPWLHDSAASLQLETEGSNCIVVRRSPGDLPGSHVVAKYRPLDLLWVELQAEESRNRGPILVINVLSRNHPAVQPDFQNRQSNRVAVGPRLDESFAQTSAEDDAVTQPCHPSNETATSKPSESLADIILSFTEPAIKAVTLFPLVPEDNLGLEWAVESHFPMQIQSVPLKVHLNTDNVQRMLVWRLQHKCMASTSKSRMKILRSFLVKLAESEPQGTAVHPRSDVLMV